MNATLLVLALILPAADTKPEHRGFEPNPLAPSLPLLSSEEEDRLDEIIHRFTKFDIGQLKGEEGRKAQREFEKLGTEAIPALIRGLNRAARLNQSCPTAMIAKKLARMLGSSDDRELLEFARENIGIGVERSPYAGLLRDLRTTCSLRKGQLARITPAGPKPTKYMTTTELSAAASTQTGARLKTVLFELQTRRGDDVLAGLSTAALSSEADVKKLSRDLLDRYLARQDPALVKLKLKDNNAEVRQAATRVVAAKVPSLAGELIDLLGDAEAEVRESARLALTKVSREDFGPTGTTRGDIEEAQAKWRAWWAKKQK